MPANSKRSEDGGECLQRHEAAMLLLSWGGECSRGGRGWVRVNLWKSCCAAQRAPVRDVQANGAKACFAETCYPLRHEALPAKCAECDYALGNRCRCWNIRRLSRSSLSSPTNGTTRAKDWAREDELHQRRPILFGLSCDCRAGVAGGSLPSWAPPGPQSAGRLPPPPTERRNADKEDIALALAGSVHSCADALSKKRLLASPPPGTHTHTRRGTATQNTTRAQFKRNASTTRKSNTSTAQVQTHAQVHRKHNTSTSQPQHKQI